MSNKMAKKIWYSKCLENDWEIFNKQKKMFLNSPDVQKRYGNNFKDDLVFNYLANLPQMRPYLSYEEKVIETNRIALLKLDYDKKVKHVFFKDKELRDYLQDMPLADLQGIKQYIKDNGDFKSLPTLSNENKIQSDIFGLCLHIPYEKSGYSCYFQVADKLALTCEYKDEPLCFAMTDERYELLNNSNSKTKEDENDLKAFRLAINTIAYMNCFPSCVIDGVLKELKEVAYSDFNFCLEKSDKIIEIEKFKNSESGKSVTPHFRNYYFKLLKSDKFTHKKGQIIFVNATMVKGNSKTVLTDESIELKKEIINPDTEVIQNCKNEDEKIISELKTETKRLVEKYEYVAHPVKIEEMDKNNITRKIFSRNRQVTFNALARAKYHCEYNPNHEIFIRKHSDKGYTEAHHLILMEYQETFLPYSLDVEANIVSLCSNCHNQIHYGKEAEIIIKKLYNQRKKELESSELHIDLEDLLKMY